MNEISISTTSAIINDEPVTAVNARELWKQLEVGRDFSNWIKSRISEYGFTENVDYSPILASKAGRGGANKIDYFISLDMAKELCMVENNDRGRAVRQYFIRIEKQARANAMIDIGTITEMVTKNTINSMREVLVENARLEAKVKLLHHFMPTSKPGELSESGKPRTNLRRAYWTSGTGKPASILLERIEQPGLFDEVHLQLQQAQG